MYKTTILSISLYLVFAAFFQLPEIMQYDSKRILQLTLFIFVGLLFFISFIQEFKKNKCTSLSICYNKLKFVNTIILLLFVAGLVSVFTASNLKYALLDFTLFFLLITLMFSVTPLTLNKHYFLGKFILITALFFASIYIVVFFGNYISTFINPLIPLWPEKYLNISGYNFEAREVLYFDHRRMFNHTQTWTLPILIGLLTYYQGLKKGKGTLLLLTLLISVWWMLIFASGGRGTLVSVIGALFVLIFTFKRDTIQLFKNGVITFIFGGIFYFILFKLISPISRGVSVLRSSDSGRFGMWEKAIDIWIQNPLFGAGPMHYAKIIGGEPYFGTPHNFYLQFLSEWGIIAFIAFIALLTLFILMIKKNFSSLKRNVSNKTIYIAFTWSIISALIHAFFSGVFIAPMSQIWLVILSAWFIGYKRYELNYKLIYSNYNYTKIAYFVFTIIIVSIVYSDMINIVASYSEYMESFPASKFHPRFWVQGLFE